LILSCCKTNSQSEASPSILDSLKQIASTEGFKPYEANPVLQPGEEGTWDAGALGSMSVLKVGDIFHMYYEAWGVRSEKEWDAAEYETLKIGHATSKDGIHWTKDPNNPVLPQGEKGEWDATGVWDPYVIYEDGMAEAEEDIQTTAGLMRYPKTAATLKRKDLSVRTTEQVLKMFMLFMTKNPDSIFCITGMDMMRVKISFMLLHLLKQNLISANR
jgi:predicted GH43/DUF377 family glycosyl hydrolase